MQRSHGTIAPVIETANNRHMGMSRNSSDYNSGRVIGLVLKLCALCLGLYFLCTGEWPFIFLLLPVFFIDSLLIRIRKDAVGTLVKFLLLAQAAAIWILSSSQLFSQPLESRAQASVHYNLQNFDGKMGSSFSAGQQQVFDTLASIRRSSSYLLDKHIKPLYQPADSRSNSRSSEGTGHLNDGSLGKQGSSILRKYIAGSTELEVAVSYNDAAYFPVKVSAEEGSMVFINNASRQVIRRALSKSESYGRELLLNVDFPDLKYRSPQEVRERHPRIFTELPVDGFVSKYEPNPCWYAPQMGNGLQCLPYAYILGQPKCGTSDLFERLKRHQNIVMPSRKEVRWFTRGEFDRSAWSHEGEEGLKDGPTNPNARLLGPESSIFSFTRSFRHATQEIQTQAAVGMDATPISIDGGPHTLWWPTQNTDGTFLPQDIPAAQIIREIHPQAKFLITVSDPVRRMYSDYYFLDDSLKPLRPGHRHTKSAVEFHRRVVEQVDSFRDCVDHYTEVLMLAEGNVDRVRDAYSSLNNSIWLTAESGRESTDRILLPIQFRAAQMCAHDRHRFAIGGWGRLAIGLYVLFYEKWLEHFPPEQFLFVRLEDYDNNPQRYMERVFKFLGVPPPDDWDRILGKPPANSHRIERDPILEETETLLRDFYRPYNELLVSFLREQQHYGADGDITGFYWHLPRDVDGSIRTLRSEHLREQVERHGVDGDAIHGEGMIGHDDPDDRLRHDQHGFRRHANHDASDLDLPAQSHAENIKKRLRGARDSKSYSPRNFSIDDLPSTIPGLVGKDPAEVNALYTSKVDEVLSDDVSDGQKLCMAAFTLNLPALKKLLYEIGVPGDERNEAELRRNGLHCLTLLYSMGDAHSKSHVFAALKGVPSWLTPIFDPPLELKMSSVLSSDVVYHLEGSMHAIALWLLAAGANPSAQDNAGWTPLHFASMGGALSLVKLLLQKGADPNLINAQSRTPLHVAAAYGYAEISAVLMEYGADPELQDEHFMRPIDIFSNPGVITASDAQQYLNITQRPAKQIQRYLHPEYHTTIATAGEASTSEQVIEPLRAWTAGDGGWSPDCLRGFEDDMDCTAIDQYWAHEITEEDILNKYLARNAPVMIRGLLRDWQVVNDYRMVNLREVFGTMRVQVSDIPYAEKFGGAEHVDMTLSEYIEQVKQHKMVGGTHPWYVFKGHPIPRFSESEGSLVPIESCPTPRQLQGAFERINPVSMRGLAGAAARKIFVNAQWALGGAGTGAPVHFHNTAWNALIYGAKKWYIYPPRNMVMSNKQILDFVETDRMKLESRGIAAVTCVQTAGDVLMIPESWGHGVLNIQESVAVATESKQSLFRVRPGTKLFQEFSAAPPKIRHRGKEFDRDPKLSHQRSRSSFDV